MKRHTLSTALSGLLLASAGTAWSMDLMQAYQAAQKQDANILASRAAAQSGRERLPQAISQLLPNISASASQHRNNLNSIAADSTGKEKTTDSRYTSSNQTVSLRQPLFRPYQIALYNQAKAQETDANATLAQEEQNLAVRVSSAYFEVMLTHEQLALVLAQRASFTVQLDAARKAFAAGSGTRTDGDEAQAKLDMNLAQEIEARQNVDYTLRQLEMLVNQPVAKVSSLNVAKLELLHPQPNSLTDWVKRAELHSPQLQALTAQLEAAGQEVNKAMSEHLPTLDLVAQWSRSKSESITNIDSRYTNAAVGLQLNVPLFSGGYVNSLVRQALADQERVTQALEANRRDLGLRVHKEFRGVTESIPKIKALEQAMRSADQLVLSSRKSFQAGSRTTVDILNAEQQRVMVQRDLAQARYQYLLARIRLLSLVGAADAEAMTAVNSLLQD
jgi:outer membrane protein, protease secretion system